MQPAMSYLAGDSGQSTGAMSAATSSSAGTASSQLAAVANGWGKGAYCPGSPSQHFPLLLLPHYMLQLARTTGSVETSDDTFLSHDSSFIVITMKLYLCYFVVDICCF